MNIPFIDALSQMPMHAKSLKEILPEKGKMGEHKTIALGEECRAIVLHKLPTKLKKPGSFSMPCLIRNVSI